jgi:hypothetical protein
LIQKWRGLGVELADSYAIASESDKFAGCCTEIYLKGIGTHKIKVSAKHLNRIKVITLEDVYCI